MAKSIATFEGVFDGFKSDASFFSDQVKTITFTITSGGTINPVTGVATGATSTVYTADGFRRDVKKDEFSDVKALDFVFTVKQSELAYTPKIDDKPVIDGVTYTVINYKDLGSVAYAMQLRG